MSLTLPASHGLIYAFPALRTLGQIAQSVEQGTENPCVGGSIPPLATILIKKPA